MKQSPAPWVAHPHTSVTTLIFGFICCFQPLNGGPSRCFENHLAERCRASVLSPSMLPRREKIEPRPTLAGPPSLLRPEQRLQIPLSVVEQAVISPPASLRAVSPPFATFHSSSGHRVRLLTAPNLVPPFRLRVSAFVFFGITITRNRVAR